jgi:hypothetical protein
VWSGEGTDGFEPQIVGDKGERPDLERHARARKVKVPDLELQSWPGEVTVPIWTSEAFVAANDKRSHLNVRMWFWNRGQSWPASIEGRSRISRRESRGKADAASMNYRELETKTRITRFIWNGGT